MPTDLPRTFAVEHDYSALDAHTNSVNATAKARLFLAIGAASLAAGAGVGLAAYGISFALEPKVITTERVVVQKEIERVEIPKIVTETKIERVEVPHIVEKQVQVPVQQPQPLPAPPRVGDKTTDAEFQRNPEFQGAAFNGRITGIVDGTISFSNGRSLQILDQNGLPVGRPTTKALNGKLAYCAPGGTFPNGRQRMPCNMNQNGTVVNLMDEINSAASGGAYSGGNTARDPFEELFN